jgi:7-cyano-7-deazaguanine reductase
MIGTFHETVADFIFATVKKQIDPKWLLVVADFFPRGNVNTTIVLEYGKRPASADFVVKTYKEHTRSFTGA